jgi:hypothetical protein
LFSTSLIFFDRSSGIDQPSVLRLAGSILNEINDEWQAADRRYFSLETMRELTHPEALLEDLGPLRLAPIH